MGVQHSCDDGNRNDGDGCSATCEVEIGYECRVAGEACVEKKNPEFDIVSVSDSLIITVNFTETVIDLHGGNRTYLTF